MSRKAQSRGKGAQSEQYACPCGGTQQRGGRGARPWPGVTPWVYQSGKRTDRAQCHARRLKPSSLAGEDRAWGHARRLKPSSLAGEDRAWGRVRLQKPAALAYQDRQACGQREPRVKEPGQYRLPGYWAQRFCRPGCGGRTQMGGVGGSRKGGPPWGGGFGRRDPLARRRGNRGHRRSQMGRRRARRKRDVAPQPRALLGPVALLVLVMAAPDRKGGGSVPFCGAQLQ